MKQIVPLKIAVVGVGGIGSAFAMRLAREGRHEVTLIARPDSKRLQELRREQGLVTTDGERVALEVHDRLNESIAYDLVLVTLKAYQLQSILPALEQSSAKSILFMFNNFEPETLEKAVGTSRTSFGMPFIQASIGEDGRLKANIEGSGQKSLLDKQEWVDVFNAAGLPAQLEPNMKLWLKCHVPLCIAFESVSVAALRRGSGATWRESLLIAGAAKEGFCLIEGLGFKIYPTAKVIFHRSPASLLASVLWSVSRVKSFRELLASGIGECGALIDELIQVSGKAKPPAPLNKIKAIKAEFIK